METKCRDLKSKNKMVMIYVFRIRHPVIESRNSLGVRVSEQLPYIQH